VETLAGRCRRRTRKAFWHRDLKPATPADGGGSAEVDGPSVWPQLDDQGVQTAPCWDAVDFGAGRRPGQGGRTGGGLRSGAILTSADGRPPFKAATTMEERCGSAGAEPVPCRQLNRCAARLETICLKCLRQEAGRRYATAADLPKTCVASAGEPIKRAGGCGGAELALCRRNRRCGLARAVARRCCWDDRLRLPDTSPPGNGGKGENSARSVEPEDEAERQRTEAETQKNRAGTEKNRASREEAGATAPVQQPTYRVEMVVSK